MKQIQAREIVKVFEKEIFLTSFILQRQSVNSSGRKEGNDTLFNLAITSHTNICPHNVRFVAVNLTSCVRKTNNFANKGREAPLQATLDRADASNILFILINNLEDIRCICLS